MPERHGKVSRKTGEGFSWRIFGAGSRPRFKWTPMASAVLVFILACAGATAYVGVKLYDATSYPVQYNTK